MEMGGVLSAASWHLNCIRLEAGATPDAEPTHRTSKQPTHELHDLATRARAEFKEMPGMCLTTAQAARLWQLSPARAEELLSDLVQAGFLVRRDGQRYRLPSSVVREMQITNAKGRRSRRLAISLCHS